MIDWCYQTADGLTPDTGSPAVFYSDWTRVSGASLPQTDSNGNLSFWTNPGLYILQITIGTTPTQISIEVLPYFTDAALNVTTDTGTAVTPLSGDVRFGNTATNPITYTLPTPVAGAHLTIANTSGNQVVQVTTPTGAIFTPSRPAGATNTFLYGKGTSIDLVCDGTNYWVLGSNVTRVGVVEMFAGSVVPQGALLCDGSSLSTSDYADLFSVIGYVYGGSGASFSVPDFRSVSPIGAGTGTHTGTAPRSAGNFYGAQSHTLLASDIPDHSHANPGLEFVVGVASGQENSINYTPGGTSGAQGVTFAAYTGTTTVPGQSTSFTTVTPSLGINFIIWAQ
jgi:microcystin-dependent protein